MLALAEIYDGGSRSAAARIGGVGLQIVRDWVIRFNARGPDGLLDGKAPGPRSRLNDTQRQALVDVVESGPIPAIHGAVRWRLSFPKGAPVQPSDGRRITGITIASPVPWRSMARSIS